MMAMFQTKF